MGLIEKYNDSGLNLSIPFTRAFVNSTAASSVANFQIALSPQMGKYLKQILYVPFNGLNNSTPGNMGNYYDCSNRPGLGFSSTISQKVLSFRTYLGSVPLSDDNITPLDAYNIYNKQYTVNTCFVNSTNYLINFFHLDKFFTSNNLITDDNDTSNGIPMITPIDYRFESTTNPTNASATNSCVIDHTVFVTFTRLVRLSKEGNTYGQ
jgi:hypothetical protein